MSVVLLMQKYINEFSGAQIIIICVPENSFSLEKIFSLWY